MPNGPKAQSPKVKQRAHRLLGSSFGFAFQVGIEFFMKFKAKSRMFTEVSRTPLAQSEEMKQNGAEKHRHGSRTGRRKMIHAGLTHVGHTQAGLTQAGLAHTGSAQAGLRQARGG